METIMEAVKRNVCRGVIFLMACLTCVVVFGSGLIAEAAGANTPYAGGESYTALIFEKVWEDGGMIPADRRKLHSRSIWRIITTASLKQKR